MILSEIRLYISSNNRVNNLIGRFSQTEPFFSYEKITNRIPYLFIALEHHLLKILETVSFAADAVFNPVGIFTFVKSMIYNKFFRRKNL